MFLQETFLVAFIENLHLKTNSKNPASLKLLLHDLPFARLIPFA